MTDVTSDTEAGKAAVSGAEAVNDGLVAELVARAQAGGVKLTGEGGLLQQLTKRVLESALEGELTDHLGHEPGERAEGGRENYRNGHRSKTVITESEPVEIVVPRDRAGSFEPQLVKKRQRRLGGVDTPGPSPAAKQWSSAAGTLDHPPHAAQSTTREPPADQGPARQRTCARRRVCVPAPTPLHRTRVPHALVRQSTPRPPPA
jgi:hypothetical protein